MASRPATNQRKSKGAGARGKDSTSAKAKKDSKAIEETDWIGPFRFRKKSHTWKYKTVNLCKKGIIQKFPNLLAVKPQKLWFKLSRRETEESELIDVWLDDESKKAIKAALGIETRRRIFLGRTSNYRGIKVYVECCYE